MPTAPAPWWSAPAAPSSAVIPRAQKVHDREMSTLGIASGSAVGVFDVHLPTEQRAEMRLACDLQFHCAAGLPSSLTVLVCGLAMRPRVRPADRLAASAGARAAAAAAGEGGVTGAHAVCRNAGMRDIHRHSGRALLGHELESRLLRLAGKTGLDEHLHTRRHDRLGRSELGQLVWEPLAGEIGCEPHRADHTLEVERGLFACKVTRRLVR
eukprot:scaffold345_cov104-Isochrysis_galbana.AAC.16